MFLVKGTELKLKRLHCLRVLRNREGLFLYRETRSW